MFDITPWMRFEFAVLIVIGLVFMFGSFWLGLIFVLAGLLGDVLWVWLQRRGGRAT